LAWPIKPRLAGLFRDFDNLIGVISPTPLRLETAETSKSGIRFKQNGVHSACKAQRAADFRRLSAWGSPRLPGMAG